MPGRLAIVLSGGGAKGAFQVGVLDALINEKGVKPAIVVGTSTGAIQALGVAQEDVSGLKDVWLGLKGDKDIYKKRGGPVLAALLEKKAIYDARPLYELLKKFAKPAKLSASPIELYLGVVSLKSGKFEPVHKGAAEFIHDWVYASCAMPALFDPLEDKTQEQWVDGGVRDVTPLGAALARNPSAVLVIRASPSNKLAGTKYYKSLVSIALRAVDLLQAEVSRNDLANTSLINGLLATREQMLPALIAAGHSASEAMALLAPLDGIISKYQFAKIELIEPEEEFSETLEFDPEKIRRAITAGQKAVTERWPLIKQLVT